MKKNNSYEFKPENSGSKNSNDYDYFVEDFEEESVKEYFNKEDKDRFDKKIQAMECKEKANFCENKANNIEKPSPNPVKFSEHPLVWILFSLMGIDPDNPEESLDERKRSSSR